MRLNLLLCGAAATALALLTAGGARAQVAPPFFNGAATAFTPEISVVESGTVNDVKATVSADRKYVTLTMRAADSSLVALRTFTFQQGAGNLGFVGLSNTGGGGTGAAAAARPAWDVRPKVQSNVLARPGMTRVGG